MEVDPMTWEYLLRLGLAALLGGIIGLERESRLKGAGIRTHLIVTFTSCMIMLVSKYGFADMLDYETIKFDPSRIAAGLVAAIGFLAGGTIFSRRRSIMGLSTAAGLWAAVGIGMSVGAGLYIIACVGTVFLVVVQHALHREHDMLGSTAVGTLLIQIDDTPEALDSLHLALATLGANPISTHYERAAGVMSVEVQLDHLPCPERELGQYLIPLVEQPYVRSLLW